MRLVNSQQWASLERSSPHLFLAAGVMLVGYAGLKGVAALTGTVFATPEAVLGPGGFVVGFVGLLGLYPALAERRPTRAAAGAIGAVAGALGFGAIVTEAVVRGAGIGLPAWTAAFLLPAAVGMILGYLASGLAAASDAVDAPAPGYLLVVPAIVFATMLAQGFLFARYGMFTEAGLAWSAFAISSGQAVAHLAIASTLRGRRSSGARTPVTDITAG